MFSSFYNSSPESASAKPHAGPAVQHVTAMTWPRVISVEGWMELTFSGQGPRPFSLSSCTEEAWWGFDCPYFNRREALISAQRLREARDV